MNFFDDFYDYLKKLSANKNLNIKKSNDKISIILNIEVLFKQQTIEIDIFFQKKDKDVHIKEIWNELFIFKEKIKEIDTLKKENEEIKKENETLKRDVEKLKKENKEINDIIEIQNKEIEIIKEGIKQEIKPSKENLNFDGSVIMTSVERNMIFQEIENKMNKKIK